MDGSVDLLDEEEASVETNGASEGEESQSHDGSVSEVQKDRNELCDLELREEIKDDIKIHVESRCSWSQESPPMPVVILTTKLEVTHDDGDLSTCQDEDQEHDSKETEDVIELVKPNWWKNEEQLNEDSTKW